MRAIISYSLYVGICISFLLFILSISGVDWPTLIGCSKASYCYIINFKTLDCFIIFIIFFCLSIINFVINNMESQKELFQRYSGYFKFLNSRKFKIFLLITGATSIFAFSEVGNSFIILCIFSVIGWPIVFFMCIAPAVFMISMVLFLIYNLLVKFNFQYKLLCAPLTVLALVIPPFLVNQVIEWKIKTLTSGDINNVQASYTKPTSLALISNFPQKNNCTDLCQRLLLSGEVKKLTIVAPDSLFNEPDISMSGVTYWLEKREVCPDTAIRKSSGRVSIKGEKWRNGMMTAADMIQLKIASGTCLMVKSATAEEADAIVSQIYIRRSSYSRQNGFSLFSDFQTANRLSYLTRQDHEGSNKFDPKFQLTSVRSQKLWPALLPAYTVSSQLRLYSGFGRYYEYAGDINMNNQQSMINFLTDRLKFNLKMEEIEKKSNTDKDLQSRLSKESNNPLAATKFIKNLLNSDDKISRSSQRVVTDYFVRLNLAPKRSITKGDAELALKILQDKRFAIPRHASAPIRLYAKNDTAMTEAFAKILFDRLFETDPSQKEDDPKYLGYTLNYLASAIAALPDRAILPYRAELQRLARDQEARVQAYRALRKLAAFGEEGIDDLIYLIDNAPRSNKKSGWVNNQWQHPYLGGMLGLCDLRDKGRAAISLIYDRLDSGKIVKFGSYWKLTFNTLVGMGAEPDEMWKHMQTKDHDEREKFDKRVKNAKSNLMRPKSNYCYY